MRRNVYFIGAVIVAVILTVSFLPIFGVGIENHTEAQAATASAVAVDYGANIPGVSADSAIVIDAESLSVLYAKNADAVRGMASTTKIMTALVAIENCDPETEFLIPKEAVGVEGSSVYLLESEPLTLRELLYCLLLESGNDAATAIAVCCGDSVADFAEMMNKRATELGLKNTHFSNPHGLSDDAHRTTARELALITAEAMKYPLFREIVATKSCKVRYDGVENGRVLTNHNKLLNSYEGATGVKTGYTSADGRCLVSSAKRNGLEIIAVTLHDDSPTSTHTFLLNEVFERFERTEAAKAYEICAEIPVENGEDGFLTVCNTQDIYVCLPKGTAFEIELILPEKLSAPVEEGGILASAKVVSNGKEVYIIQLESTETIKEKKKSFWEKLLGE